jgi:hypothetical protein
MLLLNTFLWWLLSFESKITKKINFFCGSLFRMWFFILPAFSDWKEVVGNKETKVVGDNYWRTDRQIHTEIQTETETKIDVERKWRVEQQFLRGNNCSQGYVSYINRPIGKRLGDFNLSKKSTFSKVRSVSISSFIFIEVASLKLVAYSVFFRSNHICQTKKL